MNAKINNLIKQSYVTVQTPSGEETTYFSQEKFAELIVRECAEMMPQDNLYKMVLKHFGVEE